MNWYTEEDEKGNTTYLASSAWHDDGVSFTYRLVPILHKNKVRWMEQHDAELQSEPTRIFNTVREGKQWVEKAETDSLKGKPVK